MEETANFGRLAQAVVTAAATSTAPSTKASNTSTASHKRHFLETFRRWGVLFKRKDGVSVEAEKWLIIEYYDSLRHLSPAGLDALTRILKEECTFFPTIKECLEYTRPKSQWDYSSRCLREPRHFLTTQPQLAAPVTQIEDRRHG